MLKVKKSRIPNAGKGLFTTSPIKKGDIIVEYKGIKTTWKKYDDILKKHGKKGIAYFYYISNVNCIDALPTPNELARYANDAEGFVKIKGLRNNCEYNNLKVKGARRMVPFIVSTKNIPAGAEILVEYGNDYWDAMKAK